MSEDQRKQLDNLIARRSKVLQDTERIKGRYEQLQQELAQVDKECRAKNLDPEKLVETLDSLKKRYAEEVSALETSISQAERDVAPFLDRISQ